MKKIKGFQNKIDNGKVKLEKDTLEDGKEVVKMSVKKWRLTDEDGSKESYFEDSHWSPRQVSKLVNEVSIQKLNKEDELDRIKAEIKELQNDEDFLSSDFLPAIEQVLSENNKK